MSYNKLIKFKTRAKFDAQVKNIPNTSIVFIEDTGEIWTHGKFYCKTDGSDHNHNGIYLPINGTAADSTKLNGKSATSYVRNEASTSTSTTNFDANNIDYNSFKHDYRWNNVGTNGISSIMDLTYSPDWRTQLQFQPSKSPTVYIRSRHSGTTWTDWGRLWTSFNFDPSSKANLASPTFTGTPTAPTAAAKTNTTQIATTAFVRKEVSDLVNGAPETLDTLAEIAAYLTDGSVAGSIVQQLAGKVNKAGDTMTGNLNMPNLTIDFKSNSNGTRPQIKGFRSAGDLDLRLFGDEGGFSYTTYDAGSPNRPPITSNNANGLFTFNTHNGSNFTHQLAFNYNGEIFHRRSTEAWSRLCKFGDNIGTGATNYAAGNHGHTGLGSNSWGGISSKTGSGYIDLGPANASGAHIYTDRPSFYFNKDLYIVGAAAGSGLVYHTGNSNLSTINWNCSSLNASAGITGNSLLINSATDTKIILNNTDTEKYSYIRFRDNGTDKTLLGVTGDYNVLNWSGTSIKIANREVWHAGNSNLSTVDWNAKNLRLTGDGGTGDVQLELWRGINASWKILNSAGNLKLMCNYTSTVGNYFDVLNLNYNTGNAQLKGTLNAGGLQVNSKLVSLEGHTHDYLPLSGGIMTGKIITSSSASGVYGGAIEIRERGSAGTSQRDWDYAPSLTFHWANTHAKKFGLRSDGQFAIDNIPISIEGHTHNNYLPTTLTDVDQIYKRIGPDNTTSYLKSVVLLLPALKSTNWSGINHISGQFTFFKTGGNVYDTVDIIVNYVYNHLAYSLTSHGQNGEFKLGYCTYNGIRYLCLVMPYHANPYTNAYFRGIHKSAVDPAAFGITYLSYYNESTKTPIIAEINDSLSTVLTESITTGLTNYGTIINNGVVQSIGGFKGSLIGNASSATKLESTRTIWGQNFDGTGNVNGLLSNVSGINFTDPGGFVFDQAGNLKAQTNSTNTWNIHVKDTSNVLKAALTVHTGTGLVRIGHIMSSDVRLAEGGGKVGIGISNPTAKLHVNGDVMIDERITARSGKIGLFEIFPNMLVLNDKTEGTDLRIGSSVIGHVPGIKSEIFINDTTPADHKSIISLNSSPANPSVNLGDDPRSHNNAIEIGQGSVRVGPGNLMDIPGLLLAGNVTETLEIIYAYGKRGRGSFGPTTTFTASRDNSNLYRITHNLGHTNYTISVTPWRPWYEWNKIHVVILDLQADYFQVVFIDSGTNNTWKPSGMCFQVFGENIN